MEAPEIRSATRSFAVTTHDTNPLAEPTRRLWVGGAGIIICRFAGDSADRTLSGVPAGTMLDVVLTHIRATGTTATLMVGLV